MLSRLFSRPAAIAIGLFFLVAAEATVLLGGFGLGYEPLVHYDYLQYNQLALNMLDQATFSDDTVSPFRPTLYRAPGYPAFIAVMYLAAGRSVIAVRAAQFFLLWMSGLLLYLVGRHYFSARAAVLGALFAVLYPPFVFMAPLYGAHSLTLFIAAAVIYVATRLKERPSPSLLLALALGGLIGYMALVRPAFTLVAIFVVAFFVCVGARPGLTRRLPVALVLLLGFSIVILPWIARNNLITAGRSGSRIMTGGWALYVSALQYTGKISHRLFKSEWDVLVAEFNERNAQVSKTIPGDADNWLALKELEVERSYTRAALLELSEADATAVLRTVPSRLFWLWSTADVSPWQVGLFHRFVQVSHASLAVLGFCGLLLSRRQLLAQWPLWFLAVYQTLLHFVFHVEARFTLEARLPLCLYAGVGCAWLCSAVLRMLRTSPATGGQAALLCAIRT